MTTQQLLDVLRDARDEGLWQEQAAILEELAIDSAYAAPSLWTRCKLDPRCAEAVRQRAMAASQRWIGTCEAARWAAVSNWTKNGSVDKASCAFVRAGLPHVITDDDLYAQREHLLRHGMEQFGVSQLYATV